MIHQLRLVFVVLTIVFSGFASLAVEVIGARVLESIYGSTHTVWAAVIAATLGGLSAGYLFGGVVAARYPITGLPAALLLCGSSLLTIRAGAWAVTNCFATYSTTAILATAFAGLFIPSLCFGVIPPLAFSELARMRRAEPTARLAVVYALGTLGGMCGGLWAALIAIPIWGVSTSLTVLALLLAALGIARGLRVAAMGAMVVIAAVPNSTVHREGASRVLAIREGAYQTIRVVESARGDTVYFTLGPACESAYNPVARKATGPYARIVMQLALRERPRRALIIGGAGNALALELESVGIDVTSIELDPEVVAASEEYFGVPRGRTLVGDGRAILHWNQLGTFDLVLLDAFRAPGQLPAHMVTREFLRDVNSALSANGTFIMNTICAPDSHAGGLAGAFCSTLRTAFRYVRAFPVADARARSPVYQNTLFFCTMRAPTDLGLPCDEWSGPVATDDRNVLDRLMSEAQMRGWSGTPIGRRTGGMFDSSVGAKH